MIFELNPLEGTQDNATQPEAKGRYSALEKIVAKGRQAEANGDNATLEEINQTLRDAMKKADMTEENSSEINGGWQPLSDERRDSIEAMPTEYFYVDSNGRKKRGVEGVIPQFPTLKPEEEAEIISSLEPVNVIVDNPTLLTEDQWLKAIESIPNFEGDKNKCARFMYDIAYGILSVHNKQVWEQKNKNFVVPAIVIYYGKNRDTVGIHYQASTNQIIISSSYLAQYSRVDESDRIRLRSDIQGNEVVFMGRIRNWASLIGVEEATHAVTHQRDGITAFVEDRRKVASLAEYDSRDEEYEALLEQLDFAKKEKMDKETIKTLELRIRLAKQVRRDQGKYF